MITINLLPHREEKRRARRKNFYVSLGASAGAALLVGLVVHLVIVGYIEAQEGRNNIFKLEIAKLDKEIAEIRQIREQINALLARKQVIEDLQSHRAETVHLFNELVMQMPEGVALRTVSQSGLKIALAGTTQSNARVSTLMRNIEGSAFLEQPQLVEIRAASRNGRRVGDFQMNSQIERPKKADGSAPTASTKGVSK
jgi:type IV pilus assembly protein PilN